LQAVEQTWKDAAGKRPSSHRTAKELAIAFRRDVQLQRDLIRWRIPTGWVKKAYPIFCQAEAVIVQPPWKDFAHELDTVMPKKRLNERKNGKRVCTSTYYLVPDPAAAVIDLAAVERKRA
jgi:hypothetical protein